MAAVGATRQPLSVGQWLGPAEHELYAGILASLGSLVSAHAAVPHDPIDVFRMAYALLDGLPTHVVVGMAAEAIRARYGHPGSPDPHGAS